MLLSMSPQLSTHKKGGDSASNGCDSELKRLGAKHADGQTVIGGSILYHQRGTKVYPGIDAGVDGDDTLFTKADGVVRSKYKDRSEKQMPVHPVA